MFFFFFKQAFLPRSAQRPQIGSFISNMRLFCFYNLALKQKLKRITKLSEFEKVFEHLLMHLVRLNSTA